MDDIELVRQGIDKCKNIDSKRGDNLDDESHAKTGN
jgi:hypothetical protein